MVAGTLALLVLIGQLQAKEVKKEKPEEKAMKFTYVSVVVDGKEMPKEELEGMVLIVKGNKGVVKKGKKILFAGTSKMDMTKTPWTIDVTHTSGKDKGKTMKGIMEMNKDGTMRVCWAPLGKDRPKEFSSKKGSGNILEVVKEVKK
jgi:uncharacterized protein (TIGR03067 family)